MEFGRAGWHRIFVLHFLLLAFYIGSCIFTIPLSCFVGGLHMLSGFLFLVGLGAGR